MTQPLEHVSFDNPDEVREGENWRAIGSGRGRRARILLRRLQASRITTVRPMTTPGHARP